MSDAPEHAAGAAAGVPWTEEARARLERAPDFVRAGIVKLMARRAHERGRTVIDSQFLTEIRNESMLLVSKCLRGFGFEELSMDAFEVARARMRKLPRKIEVIGEVQRFLAGRTEKNAMVLAKFQRYLATMPDRGLPWTEEALGLIQRVPEGVRPLVREAVESAARAARERLVTADVVTRSLGRYGARTGAVENAPRAAGPVAGVTMLWTAGAEERLRRIPLAPIREMVVRRTEAWARAGGLDVIDVEAYEAAGTERTG